MSFIPQALASPESRSVLFVFRNEENFKRYWADKVKTVDAPGIWTHPKDIKVGDIIDTLETGWESARVESIEFTPAPEDWPDYHRVGTYSFQTHRGFVNCRVDGRKSVDRVFVFPQ